MPTDIFCIKTAGWNTCNICCCKMYYTPYKLQDIRFIDKQLPKYLITEQNDNGCNFVFGNIYKYFCPAYLWSDCFTNHSVMLCVLVIKQGRPLGSNPLLLLNGYNSCQLEFQIIILIFSISIGCFSCATVILIILCYN